MTGIFVKLTPLQKLVLGYVVLVLIIAFLLTLPVSSTGGLSQPFIDALFVATSGISTSGLSVVDIGSYYSLFGQIILLIDFQIGGVGYMSFFVFSVYLFKRRTSLPDAIVAVESLAGPTLGDFKNFFKRVILYTFIFEFIGAAILTLYWMRQFSMTKSIYLAIFHSVSTFCTAGFALFPNSLMSYRGDLTINLVINILSLIGGIGFFVLDDLFVLCKKKINHTYPRKLSFHTKMALKVTLIVNVLGTAVLLLSAGGQPNVRIGDRIVISIFQAISASTTDGFNSVDIASLSTTSLLMLILLMFVGASPGSTGGGIKTTTLGIMIASLRFLLSGKEEVNVFHRRISDDAYKKSFAIFLFFMLVFFGDLMILTQSESASLIQIAFEIVSALGNTGLSTGITPSLSFIGKLFLTLTMFIGRVGALTIGFALIGSVKSKHFKYAKGDLFVG